jgi:outer membrane protein assembly factor BamB
LPVADGKVFVPEELNGKVASLQASETSTQVYALNVSNGLIRWYWQPVSNTGDASNALALNRTIYVSVGNSLYALDADNGEQVWFILMSLLPASED